MSKFLELTPETIADSGREVSDGSKPVVKDLKQCECPSKDCTAEVSPIKATKEKGAIVTIAELEDTGCVITPAKLQDLAQRIQKSGEKLEAAAKVVVVMVGTDDSNVADENTLPNRGANAELARDSILSSAEEPYFDKVREVQEHMEKATLEDVKTLTKLETKIHGHIEKGGETAKLQSIVDSRHRFEQSFEAREANFEKVKHEVEEKEEYDPSSITKQDAARLAHFEARAHGSLEAGGPAAHAESLARKNETASMAH